MEVNKDKLIEILSKIDNRLSTIEKLLSNKENSNTIDNSNTLVPKKDIPLDRLIQGISDTKQKEIVTNILNNKYPTVTQGQYKMILDIAEQNNVAI